MGTVLTFQPSTNGSRSPAPGIEMGKLLLFTGIRYERNTVTERGTPDEDPRGRHLGSRRRT